MQKTGFLDQKYLKAKFAVAAIGAWFLSGQGNDFATMLELQNTALKQDDKTYVLRAARNNFSSMPNFILMEVRNDKVNSFVFKPGGGVSLIRGSMEYSQSGAITKMETLGEPVPLQAGEPAYDFAHQTACTIAQNMAGGPQIPGTNISLPLFKGDSERFMVDGMMFRSLQKCPTP